jgi:hypothetical protein
MCCTAAGHLRCKPLFFFFGWVLPARSSECFFVSFVCCVCDVRRIWQAALALCTTLVSPKFSKKINYCSTLAELHDKLGMQLDLPNFVM